MIIPQASYLFTRSTLVYSPPHYLAIVYPATQYLSLWHLLSTSLTFSHTQYLSIQSLIQSLSFIVIVYSVPIDVLNFERSGKTTGESILIVYLFPRRHTNLIDYTHPFSITAAPIDAKVTYFVIYIF